MKNSYIIATLLIFTYS